MLAREVGYPLDFEQARRLYQIVIPVFLGYLGTAAHFQFHQPPVRPKTYAMVPALLIRWPILVFAAMNLVTIIAFGYSNRKSASPGSGMDIDTLAFWLTGTLGILASVNNFALPYLFPTGGRDHGEKG